jgi:DNA repair protein RadC
MRILLQDASSQLVEKASLYQGTANSSVLYTAEIFLLAIIRNCPWLILCHNLSSGDPTPQPEDSRQLHRWLIGIDEEGIFIKPALLVRAKAVVTTASNRPEVTKVPCYAHACRPSSRIL